MKGPEREGGRASKRREHSRVPWSRLLLALAVGGPALAIGGVHPELVPVFAAVVLALWLRVCGRSRDPLRVPWIALLGGLLAGATLLQWLPIPGLREVAAPELHAMVRHALEGTGVDARPGLTTSPSDTLLEAARLIALAFLTIAAAQMSWRVTAAIVAVTGTAVAAIGLGHEVLGMESIYGFYQPEHVDPARMPALVGTFVNANHQSGMLLLGTFSAAGLAVDQHVLGVTTRDGSKAEVYRDRLLAALGAVAIQVPALVLSLSRAALVAFAIVAPVAVVLALRRGRAERKADPRRTVPIGVRALMIGGLVVLVAVVAQHGAWQEVSTLWADDIAEDPKLVMIRHAPALVWVSPMLGIGRGAFIDVYPAFEPSPSFVLSTHLESAPLAMLVEWGPVVGGVALIGFGAWFVSAMRYGGHVSDARPRRIVLLGVLALALHNTADFALEFVGVAAPACALAGALSPAHWMEWRVARARAVGTVALLAAIGLGAWAAPGSWSHRIDRNDDIAEGRVAARELLATRPLDALLHTAVARSRLDAGEVEDALARATVATRLRPGAMEAWLVRSDAAARLGDAAEADASMRHALANIHLPLGPPLVEYIVARYPDPESLAAVAPTDPLPWRMLVRALEPVSPAHADVVARARAELDPADPEPLMYRSRFALALGNAALALHHARLLRQIAPELAASHLAVVSALAAMGGREAEVVETLEAALAEAPLADDEERGRVEEQLVRVLVSRGDDASLRRAREMVPDLVVRPGSRDARQRRRELAKALSDR